jgi:hypothetical protein
MRVLVPEQGFQRSEPDPLPRPRTKGLNYETLAICRSLALAHAVFAAAVAEKPAARFMIRQRIRVVKRHPDEIGEGQFTHIGHQLTNKNRPPGNGKAQPAASGPLCSSPFWRQSSCHSPTAI